MPLGLHSRRTLAVEAGAKRGGTMKYCKKCKVDFSGTACPAQHPRFMYTSTTTSAQPQPEQAAAAAAAEPAPAAAAVAVAAAPPPPKATAAGSKDPLKGLVKPLKAAMAADKLVKRGDLEQVSTAVSSYQVALTLMEEVTASEDRYNAKVREKIEQKALVVRKRLAELAPGSLPVAAAIPSPAPAPLSTPAPPAPEPEPALVLAPPPPEASAPAPTPPPALPPVPAPPLSMATTTTTTTTTTPAPPVQMPASVPAPANAAALPRQSRASGGDDQAARVLRERLAVAEHDAEKARMQVAGAVQTASLAEKEFRIQLAADRAEASENRQKASAVEEKLRAELAAQRQRTEQVESAIKEMRAGVSLPEMAQQAIEEAARQAQEQLHAAEDLSREQGRKRATEVTNLAAAVADFAKVAEEAEVRAQTAESRAAAAVERAEEMISQQLESHEALEVKCDAALQENKNLRGLLHALRETVVQEQTTARVAQTTAAAAAAETEAGKQAWVSREAQWRAELAKMDAARRAAESTVATLSSTRMMMPGQINWPQRIFDAVTEKEQRIVELEMQLDEAWGTIQDLQDMQQQQPQPQQHLTSTSSAAAKSVNGSGAAVVREGGLGETGSGNETILQPALEEQAAQAQLRTLAGALRRMQRELGQERAAREQAEAEIERMR